MAARTALVFGITGIVGRGVADRLRADGGWHVIGVSRKRPEDLPGIEHIACDLIDAAATREALAGRGRNPRLLRHLDAAADRGRELPRQRRDARARPRCERRRRRPRHAALVTGLKHYLGSFDNYAEHELDTPFTEDMPRVAGDNFYYTQEDDPVRGAPEARLHLVGGAAAHGHRLRAGQRDEPRHLARRLRHAVQGDRPAVSLPRLAAAVCGPGRRDRRAAARRHLIWEATTPAAADKAFNVVNGDVFRWRKMWGRIAGWFGIEAGALSRAPNPLAVTLADAGPDWERIVARHRLQPNPLERDRAVVARRRRSRPHTGDAGRHGPQPRTRLPRLPADLVLVRRPLRPPAEGAHHPLIRSTILVLTAASLSQRRRVACRWSAKL